MKLAEIKEIAKQHNIKAGKSTKSELVRSIQQAEGNDPCFDSNAYAACEQYSCTWREDCD